MSPKVFEYKGEVSLPVAVIRRETEKAIEVVCENGAIAWIPKSQISFYRVWPHLYRPGRRDFLLDVSEDFLRRRGWL
jgi:hypothetical protein